MRDDSKTNPGAVETTLRCYLGDGFVPERSEVQKDFQMLDVILAEQARILAKLSKFDPQIKLDGKVQINLPTGSVRSGFFVRKEEVEETKGIRPDLLKLFSQPPIPPNDIEAKKAPAVGAAAAVDDNTPKLPLK